MDEEKFSVDPIRSERLNIKENRENNALEKSWGG